MTKWPNWVDLIVVTLFIRTCYSGLSHGFAAELLHLAGVVSAIAIASNTYGIVVGWLSPWMGWFGPSITDFLIFSFLLAGFTLIVHVLIGRISELIKWEQFHWTLQGLGLILGGIRGLWWAGLLTVLLASSQVEYLQGSVTMESVLGPKLEQLSRHMMTEVADRFPFAGKRTALVPSLALPGK